MKDCPHCLFSSGIVADGKATECPTCNGTGKISNKKESGFIKL